MCIRDRSNMFIKLLSPWFIRGGRVERYYAVFRYNGNHDVWVTTETGWEKLYSTPEVTTYGYNPYAKEFAQRTAKGLHFSFANFGEYLASCTLNEVTEDNWPAPSWAIACELNPNWLD